MKELKNNKVFIISFISCIVLVLALCYFGVNNYVSDTYAAEKVDTACKTDCPEGYELDPNGHGAGCGSCYEKKDDSGSGDDVKVPKCVYQTSCSAGQYSELNKDYPGCYECHSCPAGTTSKAGSVGSGSCKTVPKCVYQNSCPAGQYSELNKDYAGCYECHSCPDGTTSEAGSFGRDSCKNPSVPPESNKSYTISFYSGSSSANPGSLITTKTCRPDSSGICKAGAISGPSGTWYYGSDPECSLKVSFGSLRVAGNLSFYQCSSKPSDPGDTPKDPSDPNPNPNPGNPGGDTPDGGDGTPDGGIGGGTEDDGSTNGNGGNGGVQNNPQTGEIAIFVCWLVGITAIGYAIWYFKEIKEN